MPESPPPRPDASERELPEPRAVEGAPEARTSRAALITLAVGAAAMTIAAAVAAVVMSRVIDESPVPAWARQVGPGADILLDAETAPGVYELRQLGCMPATILDVERMIDFLATLEDAGPRPQGAPIHAARCWTDRPIACEEVARVVSEEARLRGDFAAMVILGDRRQGTTHCAERYSAEGAHLGAFDPDSVKLP